MLLSLIPLYACCFLLPIARASASSESVNDELDELIKTLQKDGIEHSEKTRISRSKPCVQISADGVSIPRAISRKSKKMVEVDPSSKLNLAYCEGGKPEDGPAKTCAVDSVCTTVYRWKKARTRSMIFGHEIYVNDRVLVPSSCMCVLGQEKNGVIESTPIIIL